MDGSNTFTSTTRSTTTVRGSRGRIDKREAIMTAALRVFSQQGYERASVDEIAAEAGVAKPTIYNHFGTKEQLFRDVLIGVALRFNAQSLAVLESVPALTDDLSDALFQIARKMVGCINNEETRSLRRLLNAEIVQFPDLNDMMQAKAAMPMIEALAGRLARLAHAGYLDIDDPIEAAGELLALTSHELPTLSALGTRPIPQDELDRVVHRGVNTFLRAFASDRCRG